MTTEPTSSNLPARILLAGASLGLLANYLIWPAGLQGPGFAIWITLLAAAALWLTFDTEGGRTRIIAVWGAAAILAAAVLVFRDLPVMLPAMWLVIFSAAAMILLHARGIILASAKVPDLMVALVQVPWFAVTGAVSVVRSIDLPSFSSNTKLSGILRGILLALPLLLIFGLLFSSADAAFSRMLPGLSDIFSLTTTQRVLLILFFTWISSGLLRGASRESAPATLRPARILQLGAEETAVVMGLLTALFLAFVMLQLTYLFGGRETIEATTGLTLAAYARRGFFELIVVAGLTLAVLLVLGATSGSQRLFRILAAILIGCVMIMLASAVQRFQLYIDAYGLTVDRLVALTVMTWFAISLALFAGTVLRGRVAGFAAGMAISGIAVTLLFGLLNPAAHVARINIERIIETRQEENADAQPDSGRVQTAGTNASMPAQTRLDFDYLLALGADAVPPLLARIDQLTPLEQCQIANQLLARWNTETMPQTTERDWRTWNASRAGAQRAVTSQASRLQEILAGFELVGLGVCVERP